MGFQYRCSIRRKCGCTKLLKKRIDEYHVRPLCPSCKRDTLKPIYVKERERTIRRKCVCDGYIYPHRKGTAPWCIHSPREPTDEEHEQHMHDLRSQLGMA